VCSTWASDRAEFLRYVQTLPGWDQPELEFDRIETNGNYEPGNVRFISKSGNLKNKRKVEELEQRIRDLEATVADLRSRKRRT